MEDDEAVEKRIVFVDGVGDLRPAFRIDRARVQQLLELEDRESHMSSISTAGSPQAFERDRRAVVLWKRLERSWSRAIVE